MITTQTLAPRPLPDLPSAAHKGDAGHVLFLAGSEAMPGAAILCVRAAQRAGAGLVTLCVFGPMLAHALPIAAPEALLLDLSRSRDLFAGRLPAPLEVHSDDVRVVGPGLGQGGRTMTLVRGLVRSEFRGPLVLDADALNSVGRDVEVLAAHEGPLVLTPHPGEARRMLEREVGGGDEPRIAAARELAKRSGGVCVLKGARTVVADARDRIWINDTGNSGMATAGAGDVLAGLLGGYLAWLVRGGATSGFDVFETVCAGVRAHGRAGDLACDVLGARGMIASDLIEHLPRAQRELLAEGR